MANARERRSVFFQLRGVMSFVILAFLVFRQQPLSPWVWLLGTGFLLSNLVIRYLPAVWFENSRLSYAVFFFDMAGLTVIFYVVSGLSSDSFLLFYLTIFMATLGESVRRSVGIAFGASALHVWLRLNSGADVLRDPEALMRIPLFFVTALMCGYLAQELRRHKRQLRGLQDIQRALELEVGRSSEDLARSEELRAAAQEMARRFRDLLEDLNAVVWEMEVPTFRVTFVSQQAERLLGYPAEKWLSEMDFWVHHIHPEDRDHIVALCRKAIAEQKDYDFEYRALAADGRVIWLQDVVRVVRDGSGRVQQLRGVMVDVSQRKQLEEQILQSQKMEAVGRLAGGVAHDFNNLLTIINGYAELLSRQLSEQEIPLRYLEEVQKAGERAAALTRRLLAFSRRQALSPQVLDLNSLVANMERLLRRLIGEDVELVTVPRPGLGSVKADPAQIEQVIMNLALNARDAMPDGGKLIIETTNVELDENYASRHLAVTPGPHVTLAISDTGIGMEAATLSHIFEPFFTTKEKGKGTGLGLATVYGIVKQSGGNVWAYSEPGRGSTFKVYLPRVDEVPEVAEVAAVQSAAPHGSETVLVVEDEDSVCSFVKGILEAVGYTVLVASRPSEALLLCQAFQGPIHLLFTDVVMPQMSGRELAERLVAMRPQMKVLYMSGYTDEAILHYGVLNPGVPFLQKPFTPDAVAHKVREVLDSSAVGKA